MKTNILNYINKLQGYKTAIKNLHWSSKHMSEHKLLDEIADSVANNQDEIAEMCQGLYGKIKINELKPKRYKITNSKKMLFDLLRDTKSFNSSIKGRELTGVRSVVEAFIGEINKFVYLMDMCIKEDIKRNFKPSLNESNSDINETLLRETIQKAIKNSLIESDLHRIIKESVNNILAELDWKTYQHAAEASFNKAWDDFDDEDKFDKEMVRSERFSDAADRSFAKTYPDENSQIFHTENPMGYLHPICHYYNDDCDEYNFLAKDPKNGIMPKNKSIRNMSAGERDVRQLANGTAKYIKGKGWTKPRSIPKGFKK